MRDLRETKQKTATATALAPTTDCNVAMGNMKSLETPMGMLLQIELLVIFTAFLLLFLVIFGSWRRRCNNDKFRLVVFTAYTLSTYVLTYALGLMHDAPRLNELYPIWAMFLMIAFGSADSISAYSLEDNEQWKSYNWQIIIKWIWVALLVELYFRHRSSSVVAVTDSLFFVLALKSNERAQAMMAASQHSLERNTKVVADYMSVEDESGGVSRGEVDPVCMTGYTFLVRGEEERPRRVSFFVLAKRFIKRRLGTEEATPALDNRMTLDKDDLITVEKVWECEGRLLRSSGGGDPHNKLKDICLSFALFKHLRLTYAGYSLPQEAHEKTWNLIRHGLLSQDDGYKRAFQVVEVELTFFFDFFYTKYGVIFQPGMLYNKLLEFATVVIGIWATTSLLKHHKRPYNDRQLATLPNGLSVDVLVTSVTIILFIVVELVQYFFMGFSEWAKVIWICQYVQNKSWQENMWIERMIRLVCGVRLLKPWERKLRQHSFLESYLYNPSWLLNNAFMATYIDQTRDGQRQSTPIQLPEEVKQAVFHAPKSNYGTKLENGQASLRVNNEFQKLLWACRLETQTQVIMVWHIATSFCEHQLSLGRSDSPATRRSFLAATSLSKYLAYLVAFAPRLLPDHPYAAEYVFDQAVIEARAFFQKCKRMEDRIKKMEENSSGLSARGETVINRGVRLGKQLANDIYLKDTTWRILADFWVEMVLYVAPSDNARAHAEHLTRGGEFVTHLWALLSHAGIERAPPTKPRHALARSNSL
ncbi:uncharacterized protein LOC115742932 [Rhodamnia argentea]|uniref:Uncharacterized protein LOC115742932 n=1 Tax=Rhodamnia argentea TaxID=178133 RepID=A0A8B8PEW3_9MYRT|nr:uncharacterized protein LOC115742932 [Rhodamnia argentea]